MINFLVSTEPADGLALLGAGTSGLVQTRMYMGPPLVRLSLADFQK